MKNLLKFLGIITVSVIIGISLSACDNGSTSGTPSGPDGPGGPGGPSDSALGLTFEYTYDITGTDGKTITDFRFQISKSGPSNYVPISQCIPDSEVKIENNKLTLKLGTPYVDFVNDFAQEFPAGITVTEGLNVIGLPFEYEDEEEGKFDFNDGDGLKAAYVRYYPAWRNTDSEVSFLYANKDGNISGSYTITTDNGEITITINLALKQGWNTVITKKISDNEGTMVTGTPSADFKWSYEISGANSKQQFNNDQE